MNDEEFELDLTRQLRNVAMPADLKANLLRIPEITIISNDVTTGAPQSLSPQLSSPQSLSRSSRSYGIRYVALAASLLGLASIAGWWALSNSQPSQIEVTQKINDPESQAKINGFPSVDRSSEQDTEKQLVELAEIDRQLKSLQLEYDQLEQVRWNQLAKKTEVPTSEEIEKESDHWRASVILNSAETALTSFGKNGSIQEQLEFVVGRFPQTGAATEARKLLAQF